MTAIQSRRSFLRNLALVSGAALAATQLPLLTSGAATALGALSQSSSSSVSIRHVLVACQENHTFDNYFGYDTHAGSFGVPAGYYQPTSSGGKAYPHHFLLPLSRDISHTCQSIHKEYDNGKMDGFYTTDGKIAMGYYNGSDINYYYNLAKSFVLCGNYFCYLLGPTSPNRLGLWTGTSGGNTTKNIAVGSLNYPTIADLLDSYGITWKCYNLGLGTGSTPKQAFNPLIFFERWVNDPRLYYPVSDYYTDLAAGTLPRVSFLITEAEISENPPTDVQMGQSSIQHVITGLQNSSSWNSSALFLTYDEGGGFF